MKNAQQQQAKNLYFQTNLSKTEIADMLDVNRRTIMIWCQQGNWDRLKLSAQHLPAMVTEKCYYLLDHYISNLLSANATISTFGPKEAAAINQIATAIKKVRTRSAVNESMEMFNFFLEDVKRKDPEMAQSIMPFIEQYIASRKDVNITDFLPSGFNEQGFVQESEEELKERMLDEIEEEKLMRGFEDFKQRKRQQAASGEPTVATVDTTDDDQPWGMQPNNEYETEETTHPTYNHTQPEKQTPSAPQYDTHWSPQIPELPKSVAKHLTNHLKKESAFARQVA
jgi:hypothetical protein